MFLKKMKLNLGCGGYYKKGYINVDAYNSIIADQKMDATDLKFADNVFDEIFASQVVEHLGVSRSIFALSEAFRVLKPGRLLIIETPDISKSFEVFLNGDVEDKKNILPWIYGIDLSGMIHKFCYPDDFLEMILNDIGFIDIQKHFIDLDKYEPTLMVVCKKPQDYRTYQFVTHYRKKILENDLININDQIVAMAKEDVIKKFTNIIKSFIKERNSDVLKELYVEGAVLSPALTIVLFQELEKSELIKKEKLKDFIINLQLLEEKNIIQYLIGKLIETSGFEGRQDELFDFILNFGKELIQNLEKIQNTDINNEKIDLFSYKLIMLKSFQYFQIASKKFIQSKYDEAIYDFEKSEKLYRNQILTYWNLGRLYKNINNFEKSKINYNRALMLLKIINYEEKADKIKKEIEKENSDQSNIIFEEPIVSLKNI